MSEVVGHQDAFDCVEAQNMASLALRIAHLADRLLVTVEELERDELDPVRLARLFGADHLAVQTRHIADALRLAAGARIERVPAEALLIREVLLAAVGPVDRYDQVGLDPRMANIRVAREAVPDLVHILSCLLEEAMALRPGPVQVSAVLHPHRALEITCAQRVCPDNSDPAGAHVRDPGLADVGEHIIAASLRARALAGARGLTLLAYPAGDAPGRAAGSGGFTLAIPVGMLLAPARGCAAPRALERPVSAVAVGVGRRDRGGGLADTTGPRPTDDPPIYRELVKLQHCHRTTW